MIVVGNAIVDVRNRSPIRETAEPVSEPFNGPNRQPLPQPGICGAMALQRDDRGTDSAPQKLVQLVGCREPQGPAEPAREPAKRSKPPYRETAKR
jgi:hypothetical protein